MLEFYEATAISRPDDMNEQLFALLAKSITGSTTVKYGGAELDFSKMQRLSMREAIVKYCPRQRARCHIRKISSPAALRNDKSYNLWRRAGAPYAAAKGTLKDGEWTASFRNHGRDKLVQPRFFTISDGYLAAFETKAGRSVLRNDSKYTLREWKWRTVSPS